jgi:hypothetical protein
LRHTNYYAHSSAEDTSEGHLSRKFSPTTRRGPEFSAACACGGKALYAGSMNKITAIALRRRRSTEPARG